MDGKTIAVIIIAVAAAIVLFYAVSGTGASQGAASSLQQLPGMVGGC